MAKINRALTDTTYLRRGVIRTQRGSSDTTRIARPTDQPLSQLTDGSADSADQIISILEAQPFAQPARPKQQQSRVLNRQAVRQARAQPRQVSETIPRHAPIKLRSGLLISAGILVVAGALLSLKFLHGHTGLAEVHTTPSSSSIAKASSLGDAASTQRPSYAVVSKYNVDPGQPRYLSIPSLGIDNAMIMNVGALSSGALATPSNIYESGWYNQSAEPGQTGAVLIDGHVSSGTTQGVFYAIASLKPGETIQIQRGDGSTFNYRVVSSQTYKGSAVNLQAAMTPISTGNPGLNLITSESSKHTIVFAEQI